MTNVWVIFGCDLIEQQKNINFKNIIIYPTLKRIHAAPSPSSNFYYKNSRQIYGLGSPAIHYNGARLSSEIVCHVFWQCGNIYPESHWFVYICLFLFLQRHLECVADLDMLYSSVCWIWVQQARYEHNQKYWDNWKELK